LSRYELPEHAGDSMIANETDLNGMRERITYFQDLLGQVRRTARADLFPNMATGYRSEIEKMQRGVMEYLTDHASEFPPAEVA
jgi:hypothetical protein